VKGHSHVAETRAGSRGRGARSRWRAPIGRDGRRGRRHARPLTDFFSCVACFWFAGTLPLCTTTWLMIDRGDLAAPSGGSRHRLPMNTRLRLAFFRSRAARFALATSCLSAPACEHASTHAADAVAAGDASEPVVPSAPGEAQGLSDAGGVELPIDAGSLDARLSPPPAAETDAGPKRGYGEGGSLCARPGHDAVRDLFCSGTPPTITSLRQLQDRSPCR